MSSFRVGKPKGDNSISYDSQKSSARVKDSQFSIERGGLAEPYCSQRILKKRLAKRLEQISLQPGTVFANDHFPHKLDEGFFPYRGKWHYVCNSMCHNLKNLRQIRARKNLPYPGKAVRRNLQHDDPFTGVSRLVTLLGLRLGRVLLGMPTIG